MNFSLTRMQCQCTTQEAIVTLSAQLEQSAKLLKDEKSRGLVKSMKASLAQIEHQLRLHFTYCAEMRREFADLEKMRRISGRLQSIPLDEPASETGNRRKRARKSAK